MTADNVATCWIAGAHRAPLQWQNFGFARALQGCSVAMRQEIGRSGWLGFGRNLLWSWWLWVAIAIALKAGSHGNFAAGLAGVGFFLYLVAPREQIPRYGLKSGFPVSSDEFLTTVVGAAGAPFIPDN